ncbi:MAG: hypothetical protein N2490_05265 [Ignavibacteria bacterium]|nr:hypothetical protein [Ignavibacteria bacterium]
MRKTVSLALFVLLISAIIYLFVPNFNLFGVNFEKLDLFSDLFLMNQFSSNESNNLNYLSEINGADKNNSDIEENLGEVNNNYLKVYDKDSNFLLKNFFGNLRKLETKDKVDSIQNNVDTDSTVKVRIAFLGDSMIEGDLISQTLRYKLQKTFGGIGVGFIPVTSPVAGFRRSIIQTFSNNWKTFSLITAPSNKFIGLSGYVFNPNYVSKSQLKDSSIKAGLSWVSIQAPDNFYDNLDTFNTIKLYYSQTDSNSYVSFTGEKTRYFNLIGEDIVNELTLLDNESLTNAKLYFHCFSPVNIYGFSIESPSGVFVDNYALRGNSGIPMISLNKDILSGINKYFNYSLIIFEYGLNVTLPETKDLEWYKNQMITVINFFKECFPNTDIVIMSVGDKCYKKGGKYITEPSIPLLVKVQEQIASEAGVAFWNLFEEMGGENSMVKWVNNKPPYANKDYTHFNYAGAEKIGILLYNQIIYHYKKYYSSN